MTRSSYNERDYSFGQAMLHLRTSIGLTQSGLAKHLGVSRRTVGEWEAGSSYPKGENLKQLIELAIKQQAFPRGKEEEAIRDLWQAAHQKILLDELWLTSLLLPQHSLPAAVTSLPRAQEITSSQPPNSQPAESDPLIDWGQALAIPHFYGREQEMTQLSEWILQERCRVVSLLGMGGIGKSALAVKVMHKLARHFEVVIFRSLRDAPSCEELLDDCLQVLAPQPLRIVPTSLEQRLKRLLEQLHASRTLLVLDNLESLLEEGNIQGHLRLGFEGYERLLRQVAEMAHQSCLLLTSREKPGVLRSLEGKRTPVRSLRLAGLDRSACEQLFAEHEMEGTSQELLQLVEAYAGNPLALKMVTETISDLFGGQISQFLVEETVIFGTIADLLQEQFARLSSLEQTVLYWLAIVREPITLNELRAVLVTSPPQMQIFEAIDSLRRRSLVETGQRQGSFTLQSVVLEYVTTILIEETTSEIQQGNLEYLIHYSLEQALAREYVRQTQERLLLAPILAGLQNKYRGRTEVEKLLLSLLDELREWADYAQGYGPANLIALLRLHWGHLRGVDLSHLVIRGAYLQGIEMQDASLAEALIRDTVFTETFDAITAVAISRTGQYWAAASRSGEVRIWKEGGQTLHLVWQAHTDVVIALSFSPDGRTLASGSHDSSIKLWDSEYGSLLWTAWQTTSVHNLAFTPNGELLASGGNDVIYLWDGQNGTHQQTLQHPDQVHAITWAPDGHLLASGGFDRCIRVWEIQKSQPAICVHTLTEHKKEVLGLASAPDGCTLASVSWDGTVKLWEVVSGRVLQTLVGHTDRVNRVAWSPDGHTLASGSRDQTIRLWEIEQGRTRTVLQGHTADVYGLVFTPDSRNLLSGSDDGTLRQWDVANGQCVRIMQGYTASLFDIDWSPDGTQLVSGGTDTLVTIWKVDDETPPRVLRGHRWVVQGVGWSPNGLRLVSSGRDNVISLWDAISGACVEKQRDPNNPNNSFFGVAWSPDGQRIASGTYLHGVQVWDLTTHCHHCIGRQIPTWIRHVAWNKDNRRLVGGGDDSQVYVWDVTDGTLLQQLSGHHGAVTSVAWSPDGTQLASSGGGRDSGELLVWKVQSGERVQTLEGHPEVVSAVAWSSSGELLVSGGSDGILRWWEVQSGKCIRRQEAHRGAIRALKVSPDGRKLASCGDDGAIRIWDLQNTELLRTLRRDRPYERLKITGIQGLTEAQKSTLQALGAIEEGTTHL